MCFSNETQQVQHSFHLYLITHILKSIRDLRTTRASCPIFSIKKLNPNVKTLDIYDDYICIQNAAAFCLYIIDMLKNYKWSLHFVDYSKSFKNFTILFIFLKKNIFYFDSFKSLHLPQLQSCTYSSTSSYKLNIFIPMFILLRTSFNILIIHYPSFA